MPPTPVPSYKIPTFSLEIKDLSHPGSSIFLNSVNPLDALQAAVLASYTWLYTAETAPTNVQHIALVLCAFDGAARTSGSLTHKLIELSLNHVKNCAHRAREEILGVLVHEVVHCYQYNANGRCPGGLIEGVAELAPPHWKRCAGDQWDAGYERTAFFLEFLENRYGDGTVVEINRYMKGAEYTEDMFKEITGRRITKLWKLYCDHLEASM